MAQWPYPTGAENFSNVFVWANTVTSDFFGIGMCLLLFAIVMISTIQFGAKKSIAVSSWITMFLGFAFWIIGILQSAHFFIIITVVGLSTLSLWISPGE